MKRDKLKKIKKTFSRIVEIGKPYKKAIIVSTIISIIINIMILARPFLVKVVIDDYLSLGVYQKGLITITMIGALYIGIVLFENIMDYILKMRISKMGENIVCDLRNRLFKFINYSSIKFHDKTSSGKLFVRITNDVEDISNLFKDVLISILKDFFTIITTICIMFLFDAKLTLISLAILPFCIAIEYFLSKRVNFLYNLSKNIRTKINVFLAESIYGIKLLKVFNRQKEKVTEYKRLTNDYFLSRKPTAIYEGIMPAITEIFKNLAITLIIVASTNKWFGITLDVGVIYVFITYLSNLFDPVIRIIEDVETIEESIVSVDKIYEILDQKKTLEDMSSGKYVSDLKGKIEFKNVWFGYEKDKWILKDVSFIIEPKQSIALVGKTGSGKTTITNLINRFYDIQKGEILIDGVNIKDINKKSLRKRIGTVLQDPFIFAKSIKDNIKLYSDLSDDVVEKVLKLSSSDKFINRLPEKSDTVASERGNNFSFGEKQLLSFARIFAHNPSIFILDEATANIDTNTEKMIQKSVDIISEDKTSIFIAHRLSTIVNVDKIIVLDKGKIVETGNHNELLNSGGYYSKLYNSYYTSLGGV